MMQGKVLSWTIVVASILFPMAWGCGSRDQASTLSDPVDIPLQPPPEWCALPTTLESVDTCKLQARCCDHTLSYAPEVCSFVRTDSRIECSCAIRNGHEVRCKESSGVTCECVRTQ